MITRRARVVLVLLSLNASAGAHHSAATIYDTQRTVTVEGVVREFRLINPHSRMLVDVTDASGKAVTWTVEFQGRLNLTDIGWTEKTITPGERLTVIGWPAHTASSSRMMFLTIIRSNGSQLVTEEALRQNEIEAVRRQRRDQRPHGQ
jgi:hypothetical protein